jgi:putative PEP-CTERM system TPR-repeat lipoprotein
MTFHRFPKRAALPALILTLLLTACGGDKPEAMLASAKDYLAKNDTKAAVIQLKNALQADPSLAEARYLLGTSMLASGDVISAEVELRKALDLKYPRDQAVPALARSLLAQNKFREITDGFADEKIESAPARADLQTSLAAAYAALGNPQKAEAALADALRAQPDNAPALLAQARQKGTAGDVDGALATVQQAIDKHPNDPDAWKLRGDIFYYARNQPDDALAAYRKSAETKANYLPGQAGVVTVLMAQGKLDEAGQAIEQLKKFAGGHPQTRLLETQLAYQKKDYKAAHELAQQLIKMAPDNVQVLQVAGATEFQLGNLTQAETHFNKALQAVPTLSMARRMLMATYLRTGQPDKALTLLPTGADGAAQQDSEMLSLAGQAYLQKNEPRKAEQLLANASQLDPQNSRKRTSVALARLASGNAAAFGELESIAAASGADTTADLALVSAHLQRGEYDSALKSIDTMEKKKPSDLSVLSLRGNTLLARGDAAGARKAYDQALQADAAYFPAVAGLANADIAENKPTDAEKRFRTLLEKNPKNSAALIGLAGVRARMNAPVDEVIGLVRDAVAADPTDVRSRVMLSELYLRSRNAKQALSAAQDGLAALPDNPALLDALGRAQMASGDANQAMATYNKLASLQPGQAQPYMRLADVYMNAKDRDGAARSLSRALEIAPDLIDAQRGLIMLNLDKGNVSEANALAKKVQQQRPKEPIGYVLEGDIAFQQKQWAAAAAAYRNALRVAPVAELAIKLHGTLQAGNSTAEASRFAADWLRDHPRDDAFNYHLGDVALGRKDFPEAEKRYQKVLEINPNNALALNNLAWVSNQLGKDGIGYAEKANRLSPNQPALMDTLAMLYADKKNYAQALDLQKRAVTLQPAAPQLRLGLAKIYIAAGEKDNARRELDTLAALGDRFPGQAEVSKLKESL